MANGRVEMAVRGVKRQCRTLRISAEQQKSVRIAADGPLLGRLLRFAARVMNTKGIGQEKTSELRRTRRNWRKPMAQFGDKVWFRKFEEDGFSSFASRITQGFFVAHHDRTGAVQCIAKSELCEAKFGRDSH